MQISHVNIRSLISSFDMFKDFVESEEFDIIGVTETWLQPDFPTKFVEITDYIFLRHDRDNRGGGVGIYIHKNIKFKLYETNEVENNGVEHIWVKVCLHNEWIGIGVIYKPPSIEYDKLDVLEDIFLNISMETEQVIMMGDLNIDLLKNNAETRYLKSTLEYMNLKQCIKEPTRITETTESLIDIIAVSKNINVHVSGTKDMLNMTDHQLVYCMLEKKTVRKEQKKIIYRDFNKIKMEDFILDASIIQWNLVKENQQDITEKVIFINSAIVALYDFYAPVRTVYIRKAQKPYITDTIKEIIRLKNKAEQKYKRTRQETHRKYYIDIKNQLSTCIKNEKKAYYEYKLKNSQKNSKLIWKQLEQWGVHNKQRNTLPEELKDPCEINKYLVNVGNSTNINKGLIKYYKEHKKGNITTLNDLTNTTPEKIENLLATIKTNAQGLDNINLKMLKLISKQCIDPLTEIINESLRTGNIPQIWKQSVVTPLPKNYRPESFSEIRPINILPTESKLLEKTVAEQLNNHLEKNNILPTIQSGFRSKFSTCTALLKVISDLCKALDDQKLAYLVLLDYSKAFDLLDHDLLLAKMEYIGVEGTAISWFKSYIKDRQQCVKIEENISTLLTCDKGVPQGSILGPILYTIYTCDLPEVIKNCKVHLYADDTQLIKEFHPNDINKAIMDINEDLENVVKWSVDHGLRINPDKSTVILIGTDKNRKRGQQLKTISININSSVIQEAEVVKNLGLMIDNKLNFEEHVNKISNSAYMNLKHLYKFKTLLTSETKYLTCDSLILSRLNYCLSVYYPLLTYKLKNRLQKIQNMCLRYSYNINRREHITPYIRDLKILNIENRYVLQFSCLLYNVVNNGLPSYLKEQLVLRSELHVRNLRNTTYNTPVHRTTKFEGSFTYTAPKTLNSMIDDLAYPSVQRFKSATKKRLINST